MRTADVEFVGITPYGQGAAFKSEKESRESHAQFEERCWSERMHVNDDGHIFIPGISFKLALSESAAFTPRKGPTGRTSRWTKNFRSGVTVIDDVVLPIKASEVKPKRLHLPSDGKTGSGSRVWKNMPEIPVHAFRGTVRFHIIDPSITEEIFQVYVEEAGLLVGVGFWRPSKNGEWGRFRVKKITWNESEV